MKEQEALVPQRKKYLKREYDSFGTYYLYVEKVTVYDDFMMHSHDFDEIVIVLSGTGTHLIGEKQKTDLKRGDVFVVKGNIEHGFLRARDLTIINLMYDFRTLFGETEDLHRIKGFDYLFIIQPELLPYEKYPYSIQLEEKTLKAVEQLTDVLIQGIPDSEGRYSIPMQYCFKSIVTFLACSYPAEERVSRKMKILAEALSFLRCHMTEPIRLEDVAEAVSVSERHLERIFMEVCNVSPMRYLSDIRLEYAKQLLKNSEVTVGETALLSGFSDVGYFTKMYKKKYGETPGTSQKG